MMTKFVDDTFVEIVNISKPIHEHIQTKIDAYGNEVDPFFIGDLGDIINKHKKWSKCLPRVEPFYAVKCNDLKPVIKLMSDMGLSFDCASKIEIEKVRNFGVDPSRIIYANPCKQTSSLVHARNNGVSLMTFDNEDELLKIKTVYPDARLVLRINTSPRYKVTVYLGKKFGCHHSKSSHLLEVAHELGLNVIGVSFHVGFGCQEIGAFEDAICLARAVFEKGVNLGFNMYLLDIGGGIPGKEIPNFAFEKIAEGLNQSLDRHFPQRDVRIIAEPGQYYVDSAFSVAVNIIGKRIDHDHSHDERANTNLPIGAKFMYYLNDGVHGNFYLAGRDPGRYVPLHFKNDPCLYSSSVWGPTCDPFDLIHENIQLPEHNVGEWLYFSNMGAYTFTISTSFNNMQTVKQNFICDRNLWEEVYKYDKVVNTPDRENREKF